MLDKMNLSYLEDWFTTKEIDESYPFILLKFISLTLDEVEK